mgnify:CR=1 FL=1
MSLPKGQRGQIDLAHKFGLGGPNGQTEILHFIPHQPPAQTMLPISISSGKMVVHALIDRCGTVFIENHAH